MQAAAMYWYRLIYMQILLIQILILSIPGNFEKQSPWIVNPWFSTYGVLPPSHPRKIFSKLIIILSSDLVSFISLSEKILVLILERLSRVKCDRIL